MRNCKCCAIIFWTSLYGAFVCGAFALKAHLTACGIPEFCGWDYQTFVGQIQNWQWIGYFGFRHPGLGIVYSPLVALEHLWSGAYLLVMPLVATITAWLIWKMSGWIGLGVWLVMPTPWCMAAIPESFPLAQLALIGSVYWIECRPTVRSAFCNILVIGALSALNGAITLTNGIKPLLGWVVVNRRLLNRKVIGWGAIGLFLTGTLGVVFFYVRTLMTGRGMGAGIAATLSWIPAERNILQEFYGFFVHPVGFYQSFVIYPLASLGLYKLMRNVRQAPNISLVLLLASYFTVDVFIHLIIGWGMSEPWVFAPHWLWMLPILVGHSMAHGTMNA